MTCGKNTKALHLESQKRIKELNMQTENILTEINAKKYEIHKYKSEINKKNLSIQNQLKINSQLEEKKHTKKTKIKKKSIFKEEPILVKQITIPQTKSNNKIKSRSASQSNLTSNNVKLNYNSVNVDYNNLIDIIKKSYNELYGCNLFNDEEIMALARFFAFENIMKGEKPFYITREIESIFKKNKKVVSLLQSLEQISDVIKRKLEISRSGIKISYNLIKTKSINSAIKNIKQTELDRELVY